MLRLRNSLLFKLLNDDRGVIHSSEYIILTTIIAIGIIVGLSTFREQLVQEYGDTGLAIERLDQSFIYSVPGSGGPVVSTYSDAPGALDPVGAAPGGITFTAGGTENDAFGTPLVFAGE